MNRKEVSAAVCGQRRVSSNFREIILSVPRDADRDFVPGMFCMLAVPDPSRLLRRPFSIYRLAKGRLSVLYKIAGEGTRLLSGLGKGDRISLLFPLGNGFPVREFSGKTVYAVAGGVGFASVFPLTDLPDLKKCVFTAGFRSRAEVFPFRAGRKVRFHIATEDGSKGTRGLVTDLAVSLIGKDSPDPASAVVCACGPAAMLKDLVNKIRPFGLKLYTALEERMACGSGICMGCVVPCREGYRRSCKDGPVFDADDVIWDRYG